MLRKHQHEPNTLRGFRLGIGLWVPRRVLGVKTNRVGLDEVPFWGNAKQEEHGKDELLGDVEERVCPRFEARHRHIFMDVHGKFKPDPRERV